MLKSGTKTKARYRQIGQPVRNALLPALCGALSLGVTGNVVAAVSDITVGNVSTRALSVVWASDEPVTSATARIYTDVTGTSEVAANVTVESGSIGGAHANGIVKVNLTGLTADTTYYVQTETTSASGTLVEPAAGALLPLVTAVKTTKISSLDQPIVNDLIEYPAYGVDGVAPLAGTLVVASVKSLSAYPVAVFVDQATALLDLNNLYGGDGISAVAVADEIIEFRELRGLNCAGLNDHVLVRYAKIPGHEEAPVISDLEAGAACYALDTVCDRTIDILDLQFVLNSFGSMPGSCAFKPDVDVVADNVIDNQDSDAVLSEFGNSEPF